MKTISEIRRDNLLLLIAEHGTMAFRFQKRIKLLPGVTVNLSRRGVSTSLGITGARVTYGHGQKRTTVGLPGTGISHTSIETSKQRAQAAPEPANLASSDNPMPRRLSRLQKAFFALGRFIWRMRR